VAYSASVSTLYHWIAQIPAPVYLLVTVVAWLGTGIYLRMMTRESGRR
jgi:hypothetical protein